MTIWVNHVTIAVPRNGTTSHTCDPSNATGGGTVVGGSAFTPTAGRLLVVYAQGSMTFSTPTDWTLPTSGSAVQNAAIYVFYRTAAGSDTFTTTHNSSNYPGVFDIYEFAAGSSFVKSASGTSISEAGGSGPSLTALDGTAHLLMGVRGQDNTSTTSTVSMAWTSGTEAADTSVMKVLSSTDGYWYGATYLEDSTNTSQSFTGTLTNGSGLGCEGLTTAVSIASGSTPVDVYQATAEEDTGQSITGTKIPYDSEADTAFAITFELVASGLKGYPGQASDAETGQAIGRTKKPAVGQAVDTEAGVVVRPTRKIAAGQATSTEIGQTVARLKKRAVDQALDTEIGQALTRLRKRGVTQATAVEIGQAPHRGYALGQAVETEASQPVGRRKSCAIGQAAGPEVGQEIGRRASRAVDQAAAAEIGQSAGAAHVRGISQASEPEAGQEITHAFAYAVAQATGEDTASVGTVLRSTAVDYGEDTEIAQAISARMTGLVIETDVLDSFEEDMAQLPIRLKAYAIETARKAT